MSCCNFSGTDNKGYNLDPKTERVVEAIYSDWTEAAGNPSFPMGGPGTFRTGMPKDLSDGGRPQGQGGRSSMGVPVFPGFPTSYKNARSGGPIIPGRPDFGFDGGAVKQNWIPLVVLGLSLVVGIGISEWATKKYIK